MESGEFMLAGELASSVWGSVEEKRALVAEPCSFDGDFLGRLSLYVGDVLGVGLAEAGAVLAHWAKGAEGLAFEADGRTELHHGLIVIARGLVGDERVGEWRGRLYGVSVRLVAFSVAGDAGEDADDVSVDDGDGLLKYDGCDGG